jgi:hypothetical protein
VAVLSAAGHGRTSAGFILRPVTPIAPNAQAAMQCPHAKQPIPLSGTTVARPSTSMMVSDEHTLTHMPQFVHLAASMTGVAATSPNPVGTVFPGFPSMAGPNIKTCEFYNSGAPAQRFVFTRAAGRA